MYALPFPLHYYRYTISVYTVTVTLLPLLHTITATTTVAYTGMPLPPYRHRYCYLATVNTTKTVAHTRYTVSATLLPLHHFRYTAITVTPFPCTRLPLHYYRYTTTATPLPLHYDYRCYFHVGYRDRYHYRYARKGGTTWRVKLQERIKTNMNISHQQKLELQCRQTIWLHPPSFSTGV